MSLIFDSICWDGTLQGIIIDLRVKYMYVVHFNYLHYIVPLNLWPTFITSHDMLEIEIAQSCNNILLAGIFGHI